MTVVNKLKMAYTQGNKDSRSGVDTEAGYNGRTYIWEGKIGVETQREQEK